MARFAVRIAGLIAVVLLACVILAVSGCGPNITSGKVIKLHTSPAGTVVAFIQATDRDRYFLLVRGRACCKSVDRWIETCKDFGGYKIGDAWTEQGNR